jgi:hypothetical protein
VENQELKWWQVRWGLAGRVIFRIATVSAKIIGLLCLVAAVGYGVLYLILPWLASRQIGKVDPRLSMVPISLPTKGEAPLSDASFDRYGFKFQLPNVEIVKTIGGELTTVVLFRNGGDLMVRNTSRDAGIFAFVTNDKRAQRLFGQDVSHSKFKLMQAAMSATPEQAKWWRFRSSENERVEYLLGTKFSALTLSASPHAFTLGPIYTIAYGGFRGFQLGNPDVPPYEAHLDLFDGADRYFVFDITGREGHGQVITQEEINAIVDSIRPSSDH